MSEGESEAAESPDRAIPLFDERYRWVLRQSLRWLRNVDSIDLDDPEQLEAAYDVLRTTVQGVVIARKLEKKLDHAVVAALAESDLARSTVLRLLLQWLKEP